MPTAKAEGTSKEVYLLDALPAGTANIGDVDVASIAAGATHIGNVGDTPPGATGTNQTAVAESNTGAAAQITATLAGAASKRTYLSGFVVTGAGATGASVPSFGAGNLHAAVMAHGFQQ